MEERKQNLVKKLWLRTKVDGECWRYIGALDGAGYGSVWWHGLHMGVHRASAWAHHDMDLGNTEHFALHKLECPNKDCWRPEHIYVGTASDNMKDKWEKYGR